MSARSWRENQLLQRHAPVLRSKAKPARPSAAYRQRGNNHAPSVSFSAPEIWYEPVENGQTRLVTLEPGEGYIHPVSADDVRDRIAQLPRQFAQAVDTVQLGSITRKRKMFPLYGMQWGPNVYLYPIEASLVERYARPPKPDQLIEARMFGGQWIDAGGAWELHWTPAAIRDFYLNNVLIHEIGHILDTRNRSFQKREQYANWFAIEYGYRASRQRR